MASLWWTLERENEQEKVAKEQNDKKLWLLWPYTAHPRHTVSKLAHAVQVKHARFMQCSVLKHTFKQCNISYSIIQHILGSCGMKSLKHLKQYKHTIFWTSVHKSEHLFMWVCQLFDSIVALLARCCWPYLFQGSPNTGRSLCEDFIQCASKVLFAQWTHIMTMKPLVYAKNMIPVAARKFSQ